MECLQCLAKVGATAEDDVLDFWNSRPIEDKLHGKIGELEAENKRLIRALKAIKKIVDKPPMSIYDAARIYAECCEKDAEYWRASVERLEEAKKQGELF